MKKNEMLYMWLQNGVAKCQDIVHYIVGRGKTYALQNSQHMHTGYV
jgi:hypothetical protein